MRSPPQPRPESKEEEDGAEEESAWGNPPSDESRYAGWPRAGMPSPRQKSVSASRACAFPQRSTFDPYGERSAASNASRSSEPSAAALDSSIGFGSGGTPLRASVGVGVELLGETRRFEAGVEVRAAQLELRGLVDVWRNLLPFLEVGELLTPCATVPVAGLALVREACSFDADFFSVEVEAEGAAAPAAIRGDPALAALRSLSSVLARVANEQVLYGLPRAHAACAASGSGSVEAREAASFAAAAAPRSARAIQAAAALDFYRSHQHAPPAAAAQGSQVGRWESADLIFTGIGVALCVAALVASWLQWQRAGRESRESRDSLRVSLARHLPRPAAFALSVAMATTMALLGWSRSKPWPSLLVSLTLAGEPVPEFSLYQLLSIPGYCAKFWADGQWYYAVAIFVTAGMWPYAKLCLALLLLHAPPSTLPPRWRRAMLEACNSLAKWGRVHVDMLTLLIIFTSFDMRAGDEAGGAPPLFAVQTHVDTKWQTMQMGLLALAVLLSQIVMVVHHQQHERQLQADAASSSGLRHTVAELAPPPELLEPVPAPAEAPQERSTPATYVQAQHARAPTCSSPTCSSPTLSPTLSPASLTRAASQRLRPRVQPQRRALCTLPYRSWLLGRSVTLSPRLQRLVAASILLCLGGLLAGCFAPLLTVQIAGFPRVLLDETRDRTFSLWGLACALARAQAHNGPVSLVVLASFCLSVFAAPVLIQLLAFCLWSLPMSGRARRAVGLAMRLAYAWCGVDVFCVILFAAAIFKDKFIHDLATERGCSDLNPMLRAYFPQETLMTESDSCIALHLSFQAGLAILLLVLVIEHAVGLFVLFVLEHSELDSVPERACAAVKPRAAAHGAAELEACRAMESVQPSAWPTDTRRASLLGSP
mmetsp:Transcript_16638/g.55966  ORF Transcript_16638/g.55966 Transcript_16638/m.55966 type:complete len:882 (+) Transcript_16638:304-2949(+)